MHSQAEDRDEILQLLYRYNHAIDSGDAEGWADTFTEDGSLDAAGQLISGREALVEFASSVRGLRHLVANPVVDISGDTGAVRGLPLGVHGDRTGDDRHLRGRGRAHAGRMAVRHAAVHHRSTDLTDNHAHRSNGQSGAGSARILLLGEVDQARGVVGDQNWGGLMRSGPVKWTSIAASCAAVGFVTSAIFVSCGPDPGYREGQYVIECGLQRTHWFDPIVYPGQVFVGHRHEFYGGKINPNSTYEQHLE